MVADVVGGITFVGFSIFTLFGSTLPVTEFGIVMTLGAWNPALRYTVLPTFFLDPTSFPCVSLARLRALRILDLSSYSVASSS